MSINLYSYFRSSAAYRVRIALNLKQLDYQVIPIHLLRDGGQQKTPEYLQINPQGLVPSLLITEEQNSFLLSQSLAIIEYLEEQYPEPALLPDNLTERAFVRSLALSIACEVHPLNNLRVLQYLKNTLQVSDEQKQAWYAHWCEQGLLAIEKMLQQSVQSENRTNPQLFCFGNTPSLADCVLIPQIFNAKRMGCELSELPTLLSIYEHCTKLAAFHQAAPEQQIDAE